MMTAEKSTGRIVGALLLMHLAIGLILPFVMLQPLNLPPGFLENASPMHLQIRIAVSLLFVGSALPIGITCAALPLFRRFSLAGASWLLALAGASFALQAADNAHLLSMLSLSQAYAEASPESAQMLEATGVALSALRKWSHYSFLLAVGCWIFLLNGFLYRFRLVPRGLPALGALAATGQIAGVTIRGLWGYPPETWLAMPLAPVYAALALWLIAKGLNFRERPAAPFPD